jgi:hypothetical protein
MIVIKNNETTPLNFKILEYIVTGDSVYYSGSLPLVEVVYKLYSANVNIQNVN